jgi:hypothetical protein
MEKFILKYNLKPGDRIVTPRSGWRLIQHHAIYWGLDNSGVHWVIENKDNIGVRFITLEKFLENVFEIKRIEYFKGNDIERRIALERGKMHVGKAYDLYNFNCEHFANYVQYNKVHSTQVDNLKGGLKVAASVGLFFMIINAITKK